MFSVSSSAMFWNSNIEQGGQDSRLHQGYSSGKETDSKQRKQQKITVVKRTVKEAESQ